MGGRGRRAVWAWPLAIVSTILCVGCFLWGLVCLLGGPDARLGDPVGLAVGAVCCLLGYGFLRAAKRFVALARSGAE